MRCSGSRQPALDDQAFTIHPGAHLAAMPLRNGCGNGKTDAEAGTILVADKKQGLRVAAGGEVLEITELQAPGKKRMKAADYLNGHGITLPARFEG